MQVDKQGNEDMARVNPWAPLNPEQQMFLEKIKLKANELHQLYVDGKRGAFSNEDGRLWSVALTQLETASMFAVKACTTSRALD